MWSFPEMALYVEWSEQEVLSTTYLFGSVLNAEKLSLLRKDVIAVRN
jgi:hypothetical protein